LSYTLNNGINWFHFGGTPPFNNSGISAIAINNKAIWVSAAKSVKEGGDLLPAGDGLYYSKDGGLNWKSVSQPVDAGTVDTVTYGINKIPSLAITTIINNITYDIAITDSIVYIANFAGMLRRTTDWGVSWQKVVLPPANKDSISESDTLNFHLSPTSGNIGLTGHLNHRVFSVYASNDSTLWVGTAGGINKTTNGGKKWRKFSHQNQTNPISGNFVVALNEQVLPNKCVMWAATVNAEDQQEIRGVSFTFDGGETWKTTLLGIFAHNIAFKDSIVYVASDAGLFRSSDFGNSWIRAGTIYDPNKKQRLVSNEVIAVAVKGDTVWVGTSDGLAYTIDNPSKPFGTEWTILRSYSPVGNSGQSYAYPLPFSPNLEVVRIHYSTKGMTIPVTIRIFNYALQPVRTLINKAIRSGIVENDEIWDGKDDRGNIVANGIYFYRLEMENSEPSWGKILVLK
jgi:hypothetical protein